MTNDKFDLSRRKLLGSLGAIGVASAGAGAGTFAYFSDTESSSNNTVSAGTLDLTAGNESSFSTSATNLAPGEIVSYSIDLNNSGTVAGDHVELAVNVPSQVDGSQPTEFPTNQGRMGVALNLIVNAMSYGGTAYDLSSDALRQRLPGAFVESSSAGTDAVNVTSHGQSVVDYAYRSVDVASQGQTISTLDGATFGYDWMEGSNNDVHAPDEAFLSLENGEVLYQREGSSGDTPQTSSFAHRDLGSELSQSWTRLSDWASVTPTSEYPNQRVDEVAFGLGDYENDNNSNPGNPRTFDVTIDQLQMPNSSHPFPANPTINLQDLRADNARVTLDDMPAPGTGSSASTFSLDLKLNPEATNAAQADGVEIAFNFGLAQESGQNVL